jgi:predicted house-cleaning noncanonical NTP pyrophosphatase (MazG superfamily)
MDFTPTDHPIENELPKLIRDRIPEIYEKKMAKPSQFRVAENDTEYLNFLLKKMVEESSEVKYSLEHNNLQEELADVLEIVDAIMVLKGWSKDEIAEIQKEKREKNGGFEKRYILLTK